MPDMTADERATQLVIHGWSRADESPQRLIAQGILEAERAAKLAERERCKDYCGQYANSIASFKPEIARELAKVAYELGTPPEPPCGKEKKPWHAN